MIDLNKEAEEFFKNITDVPAYQFLFKHAFITGANSKYVKQQIIEAQIEALKNIEGDDDEHTEKRRILHISRFQQQLKQLQNES
jgi:hypothetical protein